MQNIQPFIDSLQKFAQKRLNFKRPPKLFLKDDAKNAEGVFGKTAFYDPGQEAITLFTCQRHPKDILRSFAHELVHHAQNLRGDLSPDKCGDIKQNYAQDNEHLRNMEKEAYLEGNLCFRDWEDGYKLKIAEIINNKKEITNMSIKISKNDMKNLIKKILSEKKTGEGHKLDVAEPHEGVPGPEDFAALRAGAPADGPGKKEKDANKPGKRDTMEEDMGDADDPVDLSASAADNLVDGIIAAFQKLPEDQRNAVVAAINQGPQEVEPAPAEEPAEEPVERPSNDQRGVEEKPEEEPEEKLEETEEYSTPEGEKKINENRFGKRNTDLFERLKVKWTK